MASIFDYLNRIISQHRLQPKFIATITATIQPFVDAINNVLGLPQLFDIDYAVGDQLDIVGQWVGLTRLIRIDTEPLYFSLDTPGAGFDQAIWAPPGPVMPIGAVVSLNDNDYRNLLKARVLANQWDGTKDGAYAAWNQLMNPRGYQVLIQESGPKARHYFSLDTPSAGFDQAPWYQSGINDAQFAYDNMNILLILMGPPPDPLTIALFTGGYLPLWAAGVHVDYATQSAGGVPIFGLDVGPSAAPATYPPTPMAGFDLGAWVTLITPPSGG